MGLGIDEGCWLGVLLIDDGTDDGGCVAADGEIVADGVELFSGEVEGFAVGFCALIDDGISSNINARNLYSISSSVSLIQSTVSKKSMNLEGLN